MKNIDNFLRLINTNPWLNVVFLILALISIFISVYLYIKGKKHKKPQVLARSIKIISDKFQNMRNVEVLYCGNKVTNLTNTKLVFWNAGNETINFSDLAPTDKLRIIPKEGVIIFNIEVLHQTSLTNNISTKIENNIVEISFDYFDQNQGGIFNIVHTGQKSLDLSVEGTFKGFGKIKQFNHKPHRSLTSLWKPKFKRIPMIIMSWITFSLGLVLVVGYFLIKKFPSCHESSSGLVVGLIYFIRLFAK